MRLRSVTFLIYFIDVVYWRAIRESPLRLLPHYNRHLILHFAFSFCIGALRRNVSTFLYYINKKSPCEMHGLFPNPFGLRVVYFRFYFRLLCSVNSKAVNTNLTAGKVSDYECIYGSVKLYSYIATGNGYSCTANSTDGRLKSRSI